MNHIMADLETLGVGADASVLSIGAVKFNTTEIIERFHIGVEITAQPEVPGLRIDPGTLLWWLDDERRDAWQAYKDLEKVHLSVALDGFVQWLGEDPILWGNGATFDNMILRHACKVCGIPWPVKFYNDRCYRTVKNLLPDIEIERIGTHHSAVDDAESQARHLQVLCAKLRVFLT